MTYIPDIWTARNDGTGTGMDSDLLDGIEAAAFLQDITSEALSTLSDVTITSIASGELLKWNGSIWINQTLAEAGIAAASHTHLEADVTDLQAYLLDITGEALSTLSDVTISAIADGELLRWNGSIWINNTLAEAGIQAAGEVADLTVVAKTGAYTILTTDGVITGDSSGGTFTLTLPTAVGNTGQLYHIKKIDSSANVVTIDGDGSETIDGSTTVTLDVEWHALTVVSDGAGWLIV